MNKKSCLWLVGLLVSVLIAQRALAKELLFNDYIIPVNQSIILTNPIANSQAISCTLKVQGAGYVLIKVLLGNAEVNGSTMRQGKATVKQ